MSYFNIHTHTMYSNTRLLDSINPTDKLIDTAIEMGLKGIAITDHGILSSHVEAEQHMSKIAKDNPDFKLALGNEAYLVDERTGKQKYYHYILVAKNLEGHIQLRELSSLAYIHSWHENMRRIPNTKQEFLDVIGKNKGNLIASSACLGGELPNLVLDLVEAEKEGHPTTVYNAKVAIDKFIRFNLELFGEDFYIETAPSDSEEQIAFSKRVKAIAKAYGIKMIFATDAHFLRPEDAWVHKAYLNSKGGERETDEFYRHCYVMKMSEAHSLLSLAFSEEEIEEMRLNTLEIYDKIESYTLHKEQVVRKAPVVPPQVLMPNLSNYPHLLQMIESGSNDNEFFVKSCVKAIQEKGLPMNVYLKRADEEADVLLHISDRLGQDLTAYLNFLKYYIDMFWEMGSIVGPGRGSAVGFVTAFLLGITQVDPIKYELPAFRFLNKGRAELPDIDIDLSPSKKPAIVAELRRLLGELNVLSVATFGTEMARSAVLSACRGYRSEEYPGGIDVDTAQYLTSLIPSERGFLWSLKEVVHGDREKGRRPNRTFIEEVNKFPRLLEAMLGIEGLVKQSGLHAAGILFFNDDVYETTAIMRAPNGELCSQFSLHDAEFMGCLKFDFLVVSMSDKLTECLNYLEADGLIEQGLSLREKYNKYLHPDVLDLENPEMWKALASNQIISVFQFDSPVGVQAARDIKPENIEQMTAANSLMRLMSESGETPMERYVRMKNDMSLWYDEVRKAGLTDGEVKVLEKYYLPTFGTPATQEDVMLALMDPNICGMELSEVDKARKIIGKKLMSQIPGLKQKVFASATSKNMAQYLWDTMVLPQLGYSFSRLHSLAYSFVGIQSMTMATKFPRVYWNTAVLAVESGSAEDASGGVDYDKVAKAMGVIKRAGVQVRLPDINSSSAKFQPVAEENVILFGLKATRNISDDFVEKIVENRPYLSVEDFLVKVAPTKTQMIALIKSGSFDALGDRIEIMKTYLAITAKLKNKITLQNLDALMTLDLIPEDLFAMEKRIIRFNKQLRVHQKTGSGTNVKYLLTGPFQMFYEQFLNTDLVEAEGGSLFIQHKVWDKYYKQLIAPVALFIKNNSQMLLEKLNGSLLSEEWEKYAKGSIGHWEITQLGFIDAGHELFDAQVDTYGISHFDELPVIPALDQSFTTKTGKEIKLFKIDKISGVVCGKDKMKGLFYLLTDTGVVECKMSKEQFAEYDRQISEIQADGTKRIVAKSTFSVGNMLVVQGYRRDDMFAVKKYARTVGHSIYVIDEIVDGELIFSASRFD